MGMVVWVMMGIAVWHFAVFVPDRFWGGIVGAFLVAVVVVRALRPDRQRAATCPAATTPSSSRPARRSRRAAGAGRVLLLGARADAALGVDHGHTRDGSHRPPAV